MKQIINIITVSLLIQAFSMFGMKIEPTNKPQRTFGDIPMDVFTRKIIPYLTNDKNTVRNLYRANKKFKAIIESQLVTRFFQKDFLKESPALCRLTKFLYYYTCCPCCQKKQTPETFFDFSTIEQLAEEICNDIANNNHAYFAHDTQSIILNRENLEEELVKMVNQIINNKFARAKLFSKLNCIEKIMTCNGSCNFKKMESCRSTFVCCCIPLLCLFSYAAVGIPLAIFAKGSILSTLITFFSGSANTFNGLFALLTLTSISITCFIGCSACKKQRMRKDIDNIEKLSEEKIREIIQDALEKVDLLDTEEQEERVKLRYLLDFLLEDYTQNTAPNFLANTDIQDLSDESSSESEEMV